MQFAHFSQLKGFHKTTGTYHQEIYFILHVSFHALNKGNVIQYSNGIIQLSK
jgi:hypothetical protein